MKLTLTLCFFFLSLKAFCAPSEILVCLGDEELKLHKSKNMGPIYNLNQTLVNQIATIPNLVVSRKNTLEICHNKDFGPSLSLLRLILLKGGSIFNIKKNVAGHGLAVGQLGTFVESAPHIMFNYLNEIQALMPYAYCLSNEVPEVQYFYDRYKYLEEDLNGGQLLKDKKKVKAIFKKIKNLDKVIENCKATAKALEEKAKQK